MTQQEAWVKTRMFWAATPRARSVAAFSGSPANVLTATVRHQRGPMFAEWEAPEQVTRPYPIVLVHGGGFQGTEWLDTPDSRPGWAQRLVEAGYATGSSTARVTVARRCTPRSSDRWDRHSPMRAGNRSIFRRTRKVSTRSGRSHLTTRKQWISSSPDTIRLNSGIINVSDENELYAQAGNVSRSWPSGTGRGATSSQPRWRAEPPC